MRTFIIGTIFTIQSDYISFDATSLATSDQIAIAILVVSGIAMAIIQDFKEIAKSNG